MVIKMRMRRKPWARPELAACPYYIQNPSEYKGKWSGIFDSGKPLYMELGCGKGGFIAQAALKYPDINFIAADIKSEMLAYARRTIEQFFSVAGREVKNIRLISQNIELISSSFGENDGIDRIYINFCNPWPRAKHKKRRLTHVRQLEQYKTFLKNGGEIHFKTDDDELFEESVQYFNDTGFKISYITRDLHSSDYKFNIVTEHERVFSAEGKKIKFLIAQKV
jgi:tRNA (guanine-N7-)-methyltransferase